MKPATILLVEDNPDDVALTLRAFAKHGLAERVSVATDGQIALERLHAEPLAEPPAVILLDLDLPRVDGLEVLRRVRADARTRWLPVVVLASSCEERDLQQAYQRGANSYIRKPVVFAESIETARQLGLYWLELNELPERAG